MVQPELVAAVEVSRVVSLMTADEARSCIATIKAHDRGLRVEVFNLYERRGWEALGYGSWRECVLSEFDQGQSRLYQELIAAKIERHVSTMVEIGAIPERQLRPLAPLRKDPEALRDAWQRANEIAKANGEQFAARHVEQAVEEWESYNDASDPPMELEQVADQFPEELTDVDRELLATTTPGPRINAGLFASATPEWYTPQHIINRVVKMFKRIDLDPCSNSHEVPNVPALHHYTAEDDGLLRPWGLEGMYTSVYMNPPYGDAIGTWVERLIRAYEDREIGAAIALLPARTDTAWFQPLFDYPRCFVRGRLKFSGAENSAPFPSVIVYLGPDVDEFLEHFEEIGPICVRLQRADD